MQNINFGRKKKHFERAQTGAEEFSVSFQWKLIKFPQGGRGTIISLFQSASILWEMLYDTCSFRGFSFGQFMPEIDRLKQLLNK